MPIELEIDQMVNAESGVQLILNGVKTDAFIIPMLDGQVSFRGDMVERTGPHALAVTADVVALGVVAGNDGDIVTIGGADYTVLAINKDGHGGALLILQEDA